MSVHAEVSSRGMTIARVILIAGGLALLALGGLVLLLDVNPKRYLGIALWFAGAIVIHDAIVAPAVFGANVILRRLGRKLPGVFIVILQCAAVLLVIVGAIVLPEILKQQIGSANPTILPLDYATNLATFAASIAVLTLLTIAGYVVLTARRQASAARRARREKDRPAISQD